MKIFGILNTTPDSFSDGNQFLVEENAIKHAMELAKKCDVIDIGAQSTRPDAPIISTDEEISRLGNIVANVSKFTQTSIDSFNFKTQKFAIDEGTTYINDVSAFADERILHCNNLEIWFIFMHNLGVPPTKNIVMQTQKMEMIEEIKQWARKKIEHLSTFNITNNRMIFDIGIGFGKSAEQSLFLIENAEEFLNLGVEIMVGHSRKSFMENIKPNATMQERDIITRQITKELKQQGVQNVRVHAP
jgi:dihydropteroate synthase